jgi:hypothetical protein
MGTGTAAADGAGQLEAPAKGRVKEKGCDVESGTAARVENLPLVTVLVIVKYQWHVPGQNIQCSSSRCILHHPSSSSPLLRIQQTFFSLNIGSFLCLCLSGATLLHRYRTWLWSPKLPHLHIEHEQWVSSSLLSCYLSVRV